MTHYTSLHDVSRDLTSLLNEIGNGDHLALARMLEDRLETPRSFVTMVGETSTGKSTLVNSLLGERYIPVAARPTTAVITEVINTACPSPEYRGIRKDGTITDLPRVDFERLNRHGAEWLGRLQLIVDPRDPQYRGMTVIDTPGYNAIVVEHEEILKDFIPHSDVLVLVAGYRTGIGQGDQDLLEVVGRTIQHDLEIPVLLVINRVPPGTTATDPRVGSIVSNVEDSVLQRARLHLVVSSTADFDAKDALNDAPLPDTERLWADVDGIIKDPTHLQVIRERLRRWLDLLVREVDSLLERRELVMEARATDREALLESVKALETARADSCALINRTFTRLESLVIATLRRQVEKAGKRLAEEVDDSGKWLGHNECVAWVGEHALPFEARATCRQVTDLIVAELEHLDEELDHIANTAVLRIVDNLRLRSDIGARLADNLVVRLAQRASGLLIRGALKGLGGVGGAAAGAGNLAKMIVKNVGRMFGKTFSRQVYNQIGRTFTKRAVQRINVIAMVLIEGIIFVREAHIWKGQLKGRIDESLTDWKAEILQALSQEHLPNYRTACTEDVCAWYDEEIASLSTDTAQAAADVSEELDRLRIWRVRLKTIHNRIQTQGDKT